MINKFLEKIQYNKEINNCSVASKYQSKIDTTIDFEYSQFSKSLEAISESSFYKKNTLELGNQHKIGHVQKVMLFSQIIAQNENLDSNQTKILLATAAFHDSGRIRDRDNGEHGVASAKISGEYFKEHPDNPYEITQDEIGIVQVAIVYHVIRECIPGQMDEVKLSEICNKYDVKLEDFKKTKQISAILKDADALDRVRFASRNNLNSNLLRTKTAKKQSMIRFCNEINQEYARNVLIENYFTKQGACKDKIEALHVARHDYRSENSGKNKKEKDVPVKIIKSIFKDVSEDRKIIVKECVDNQREEDELEL